MFYKKPPTVIHWHKPEKCEEMALDACKNVRLSKRATKLFLYYASCKSGFRPAAKVIAEEFGISNTQLCNLRNDLFKHGLVGYGEQFDNSVLIDWNRIRAFAMLEEPLQYVKSKVELCFPQMQSPKEKKKAAYRKKKTIGELCWKDFLEPITWLSEDEIRWIEFLKGLTEDQYCELAELFRQAMGDEANFVVSTANQDYYIHPVDQYDDSWMHTPEYKEKMRQDIVFLKNMPQDLPF